MLVGLKSHRVTKGGAQHSPLGCRRISHTLNPISSEAKLKDELTLSHSNFKSDLHSVRRNQCNPPSNFEMRASWIIGGSSWVDSARRYLQRSISIRSCLSPSQLFCQSVPVSVIYSVSLFEYRRLIHTL